MTTDQETIIINQIIGGDTQAFAVLVDRYKDLVFTLAIRMLKNREEAEEVSQDTFIKVFKALPKFKGDSKLSTWVYKVAYNTCLDRIKKNKKHYNDVAIDSFTEHQIKTVDNALDALEEKEQQQTIQDCLQQLASKDSFLLSLFYFEELSLEEISHIVNMETNTVKVNIHRARKRLAIILKQQLEPETIQRYERERS
ncbi:RNA polymerase sigma factor [Aequorivita antarctica]|uniref:Sigma-70 family RNA polymerase sigma factor n=1 Tax=Aequorivita antarctica TaxID=153266 RepID=A0A5C6YXC2_9FLAO|nr:sigma-70 family RNA polymerase sigma factor [Aequorivita antarctica]TXD72248.1 sigma-70 family RNA polymerase sigma factor [Aequorivita antarctica]SRX74378.1 ECF RNA polymerase sigma factor SigW [Aequorivita antarctica]